jgi:hypothetical protein
MNSLSWLIYAIGLFENLRDWASGGFGFLVFMASTISLCGYGFTVFALGAARVSYESDTTYQARQTIASSFRKLTKSILIFCVVIGGFMMMINIVVPKRDTMMYIAASEIGGRIAQNEVFQKNALEALEGSKDAIKGVGSFSGEILGLSQDSVKLLRSYMQTQIETNTSVKKEPAL